MDQEKITPFKFHDDRNHVQANANTMHRLKVYRDFIRRSPNLLWGDWLMHPNSLDIGEPSYVSKKLKVGENTLSCDFNSHIRVIPVKPFPQYRIITCFEVINHVMNPLQFMIQIRDLLLPNGTCYLSCPKLGWLAWDHCKWNFVTYRPEKLRQLFEYAGFEVVRCEIHRPWEWWFAFTGIRPMLRWLFNRIQVWELRKHA